MTLFGLIGALAIGFAVGNAEDQPKPAQPDDAPAAKKAIEKVKEPIDITKQVREYHSDKYANPPNKFHPGHIKPRKLDAKSIRKNKDGYTVQLPSKAPIPTPAVYNGNIYLSGGFHSREFYCLKSDTGEFKWGFDLDDDGPSSPAVEDGVVVYNTESCTIFAHDAETGKLLWSYWLGDPLMSSPTIAGGRVFAAYPASGRVAGSPAFGSGAFGNAAPNNNAPNAPANGDPQQPPAQVQQQAIQHAAPAQQPAIAPNQKPPKGKPAPPMSHVLACFELKTGKILWQRWIDSDVMSAPVASGKELHVASLAGTIYKYDQKDGKILSAKKQRATSAPVIVNDQLVFTKRTDLAGEEVSEGIATENNKGEQKVVHETRAPNVDPQVQQGAKLAEAGKQLDAGNGFAGGAPAQANAALAFENIGQANVSTLQAYQGARVLNWGAMNFACPGGDKLLCTNAHNGNKLWEIKLEGDLKKEGGSLAAPPAAAGGRLLLSTLKGEVLEVDAKKGKILKRHKIGAPTRFQPVIADGCIFVTTQDGKLVCFKTGDKKLTGWTQWGGNAARTGVVEDLVMK
jgi:outer membrane protein assembly factor BamB